VHTGININYFIPSMQQPIKPLNPGGSPAPQRAAQWLRLQIQQGLWGATGVLPSLETLAAMAGVSRFTMWRAVRILVNEKALDTKRGSGIRLRNEEKPDGTLRWKYCEQQLSGSIYNGEFPPGTQLPPISKLMLQYSACYKTVHKALSFLARSRVLLQTGTRYLVPPLVTPGKTLEVVLLSEGAVETNEAQRSLIQIAEQQAQKIGVRLVRFEHTFSTPFNNIELQRLLARKTVAGFVIDFWGLGSLEREQHFQTLLSTLYASRKPFGILDEVGALALSEPMRSSNRVLSVGVSSYRAGADIGRYLLHSGHRRAVFLTPSSNLIWSQRRYAGLEQTFAGSGISGAQVTMHQMTPSAGVSQIACSAARLSRAEMKILFDWLAPAELDHLLSNSAGLAQRLRLKPDEIRQIHHQAKIAIQLYNAGGQEGIANAMRFHIFELIGHQYGNRFLQPTFEQLLTDRIVTAWVAATDGIGHAALTYLHEHAIDIPGKLSLVAFDNSQTAAADDLSSYDFDMQGRLHHALSFVAGRMPAHAKKHNIDEWPGILYQRQSSGKTGK
jgi:DNA-binding LacI/PurR family transcriptional regulator/DNA-binding transcriptional regulator YhcF (GntR family)